MNKIRKAIVPVAGHGIRFLPFTKAVPKEMLPIVDVPTIQLIVEELVESGITDILFITNRNKHEIEDYFDYSIELEKTLLEKNKFEEYEKVRKIADKANFYFKRQKETKGLGLSLIHI